MEDQGIKEAEKKELEAKRKPYAKPEVIYRAPLEAVAAVCQPIPPGKASNPEGCTNVNS